MLKIDLNKNYEEVNIGGRIFNLDVSDDKLRQYIKVYKEYQEEERQINAKLSTINVDSPEIEDYDDVYDEVIELMKRTTDFILEDGAFDYIYGETKSIHSCADVLVKLTDFISEKTSEAKGASYEKYVGDDIQRERAKNLANKGKHKNNGKNRRR